MNAINEIKKRPCLPYLALGLGGIAAFVAAIVSYTMYPGWFENAPGSLFKVLTGLAV